MRRKRNKANGPETTARLLYKAQASISPKMATIVPMCRKKSLLGYQPGKANLKRKFSITRTIQKNWKQTFARSKEF